MAQSLYETSKSVRKVLIIVLVIAVVYLIYLTLTNVQQATLNAPVNQFSFYEAADNALGKIEKPVINSIKLDPKVTPSYTVNAPFGTFPDTAYVYQIDQPREKLTTVTSAETTAQALGFIGTSFLNNGDDYSWKSTDGTKVLHFNKTSQIWSMTTDYVNNVNARQTKTLLNDITQYNGIFIGLINQLGFTDSYGFTNPTISTIYASLGADGGLIVPDSYSNAQYIIGDVFRKLDLTVLKKSSELPSNLSSNLIQPTLQPAQVYNSNPINGEFKTVVSNDVTNNTRDIYEFNFINYQYSIQNNLPVRGLYQVITPDEAWSNVQSGNGSITYLVPQNANPLKVYSNLGVTSFTADETKTELGYYEPEVWTGHVYPIYIFRGSAQLSDGRLASFVIYTDALKRFNS